MDINTFIKILMDEGLTEAQARGLWDNRPPCLDFDAPDAEQRARAAARYCKAGLVAGQIVDDITGGG